MHGRSEGLHHTQYSLTPQQQGIVCTGHFSREERAKVSWHKLAWILCTLSWNTVITKCMLYACHAFWQGWSTPVSCQADLWPFCSAQSLCLGIPDTFLPLNKKTTWLHRKAQLRRLMNNNLTHTFTQTHESVPRRKRTRFTWRLKSWPATNHHVMWRDELRRTLKCSHHQILTKACQKRAKSWKPVLLETVPLWPQSMPKVLQRAHFSARSSVTASVTCHTLTGAWLRRGNLSSSMATGHSNPVIRPRQRPCCISCFGRSHKVSNHLWLMITWQSRQTKLWWWSGALINYQWSSLTAVTV